MASYPGYQYQPTFGQQMQQPMYQQPAQMMTQDQNLFCRMAASRDEVTACPTDFSGKPLLFVGPQAQVVWIKMFNPVTGSSIVRELRDVEPVQEKPPFVTTADFEKLLETVRQQGEEINQLRSGQPRRRVSKEDDNEL